MLRAVEQKKQHHVTAETQGNRRNRVCAKDVSRSSSFQGRAWMRHRSKSLRLSSARMVPVVNISEGMLSEWRGSE